jgi:DNA polymerase III delta subunit
MAARGTREPDPPTQIRALAAALSGEKPLARGYVVRGEERYFREQAIACVARGAEERGFDVARHDAQDPDFDVRRLLDDLAAAPMFASARLILVRGASLLLKKEGRDASASEKALLAFLHATSPSGTLVVEAEGLRADHALARAVVERGGLVLSCRRLWDGPPPWDPDPRKAEVVQWLVARARARKVALDPGEALYVVQATGNDLAALESALDRVAERRTRGIKDVVVWTGAASPFQIAEELCRGDAARVLAGIEALFRTGFEGRDGSREVDAGALLAVLSSSLRGKLRQTLCGALARARGLDLAQAARSAGVPASPRALGEFEARLALRPAAAWRAMLDDLTDLERRSRTSGKVDASDFARLALRWRTASRAQAPVRR